jgi:orotate phosphoribosyltransferase-like protein
LSTKADQLEWRRSKVVEMRARGLSYAEIAQQLHVSKACAHSNHNNEDFNKDIELMIIALATTKTSPQVDTE